MCREEDRSTQQPRVVSVVGLEAERIEYAIRFPANRILQDRIGCLLKRPVGRPPNKVRRFHANFSYQAGSGTKSRRVIAKVEWHPSELYPRVGFIVTNLSRPAERVFAFYNKRGTGEQWIKEVTPSRLAPK
jgi:Transposase DDE domain group 1